MRASRASASRRQCVSASSSPRTWPASRPFAPTRRCPASSPRHSRSSPRARYATSASWSPCVSRRPAPRPRTSPAEIELDLDPLPAVVDMLEARKPGAPLVHEHWGDNLFLTTNIDVDFEAVKAKAAVSVTRELRTSRQVMSPIEGRGVVAQLAFAPGPAGRPHLHPAAAHRALGPRRVPRHRRGPDPRDRARCRRRLRLQGRFSCPEEVALAWATRKVGAPLRWIEDRRESLTANANCREHHYILTAYADADGRLLALDCEATVDSGAYSAYPFSACLEAGQVASILPGLYDFPHYRCRAYSVATNKPPILPYRGVARTGVCFALEVTLDALARKLGKEPNDLRFKSLVQPRADAVRQHRQAPLRLRRLPRGPAPGHRRHRLRHRARAPAARRARRPPHRHRLCHVLRAGRPRHQRLRRLGHPVGAGPRAGAGPLHARRRAGAAGSARTATARASRPRCRRWRIRSSACRTRASGWCTATPPRRPTRRAPGARAA